MHKRLMFTICLTVVLGLTAHAAQPVGHWPFDGHLSDVAGTATGTFGGGEPAYVQGRLNQAIRFDGVDDYVSVMVGNLTAYTITAWVMPERTDVAGIVTRTSPSGPLTHWSHQLRIAAPGKFEHYLYDGNTRSVVGTTQIEPGNWYFVAASAADNGTLRLYVNGEEEGLAVSLGMLWSGGDRFHIGSNSGGGIGWFQGLIDDVCIYDQLLTETDLAAMIAAAPLPFAFSPQPKNGAMLEQTTVDLRWNKGDSAVSHNVYISDSFDAVNDATVQPISTTTPKLSVGKAGGPYPTGLVPGKTYYWRVDEINTSHADSPWRGQVWSFWLPPLTAWNPVPAAGATYVDPDQDLTWKKGMATLFHTVFFGASIDEVANAAQGTATPDPVFDPGTLEPDKTYYWRVDEFAMAGTSKGEVWSYTIRPTIPLTSDPNLMLSWPLDEGPGAASACDWSGRGRHGTMAGAPAWTLDGCHGGALAFNGRNYLYSLVTPALPSQTVCAWVKTAKAPASILGWANAQPTSGTHDKTLYINADRTVSFYIWDGAPKLVTSTVPVADGAWHHVAGVYTTSKNIQLYVDGVLQGSTDIVAIFAGYTSPYLTAGIESHAGRYLDGEIDDVRVYNKVLTEEQLQQLMRGDPLLAWNPAPAPGATVEIRDVDSLSWSAGDAAASHDVYFGNDRAAVAGADKNSPLFRGNRSATSLPLAGLVEFGGGNYYWRVDEIEAGGTVHKGDVWTFAVPGYLVVDDFERYNDADGEGTRVYETWDDGVSNGTGSYVGYEESIGGTFGERTVVHGGSQSMPVDYNNVNTPYYSEISRTWDAVQDWTAYGATTLTLYLQGRATNGADQALYVALESQGKAPVVVVHPDPKVLTSTQWVQWQIPLSQFAGVSPNKVKALYVGVGDRNSPKAGGAGRIYIDDIRLTRP